MRCQGAGTDGEKTQGFGSIYYMVTGNDVSGELVNHQRVSRLEALKQWTLGSAWVNKDEDRLGSIEVGKVADLVPALSPNIVC